MSDRSDCRAPRYTIRVDLNSQDPRTQEFTSRIRRPIRKAPSCCRLTCRRRWTSSAGPWRVERLIALHPRNGGRIWELRCPRADPRRWQSSQRTKDSSRSLGHRSCDSGTQTGAVRVTRWPSRITTPRISASRSNTTVDATLGVLIRPTLLSRWPGPRASDTKGSHLELKPGAARRPSQDHPAHRRQGHARAAVLRSRAGHRHAVRPAHVAANGARLRAC